MDEVVIIQLLPECKNAMTLLEVFMTPNHIVVALLVAAAFFQMKTDPGAPTPWGESARRSESFLYLGSLLFGV
jgi:hypothetical protein